MSACQIEAPRMTSWTWRMELMSYTNHIPGTYAGHAGHAGPWRAPKYLQHDEIVFVDVRGPLLYCLHESAANAVRVEHSYAVRLPGDASNDHVMRLHNTIIAPTPLLEKSTCSFLR
jgi:hypothetical protein